MNHCSYVAIEREIPGFKDAYNKLYEHEGFNLSKREIEVLILMANELTVYKIANILCREKTTIYKHLENARSKMNCSSLLSLGIKLSQILNAM